MVKFRMLARGPAIVVMAKAPRSGNAKTRLRPCLSDQKTNDLAAAFFADTIRIPQHFKLQAIIAFDHGGGRSELQMIASFDGLVWIEQRGSDLGQRLANATQDAASLGFGPLVFLGTDSPNLPTAFVGEALSAFEEFDLLLGPAADGGYYMVGINRYVEGLFDNVAWSTDQVLAQTVANAERLGMTIHLLPEWYDVDMPDDLVRLAFDLETDPNSAPQTYRWVVENRDLISSLSKSTSDPTSSD